MAETHSQRSENGAKVGTYNSVLGLLGEADLAQHRPCLAVTDDGEVYVQAGWLVSGLAVSRVIAGRR